jgi:hypothetical protein
MGRYTSILDGDEFLVYTRMGNSNWIKNPNKKVTMGNLEFTIIKEFDETELEEVMFVEIL